MWINYICKNCGEMFLGWDGKSRLCCSRQCKYEYDRRPDIIEEKFWAKVDVKNDDECWIWKGQILWCGHGLFNFVLQTKMLKIRAHRFSWRLLIGKIPDGLEVCHNCPGGDNPACVNPNHLFLGTQQDNIADMVAKGRQNKGETNGHARLTEPDVIEVHALSALGWLQKDIAAKFGVHSVTIHDILRGKTWRYLLPLL